MHTYEAWSTVNIALMVVPITGTNIAITTAMTLKTNRNTSDLLSSAPKIATSRYFSDFAFFFENSTTDLTQPLISLFAYLPNSRLLSAPSTNTAISNTVKLAITFRCIPFDISAMTEGVPVFALLENKGAVLSCLISGKLRTNLAQTTCGDVAHHFGWMLNLENALDFYEFVKMSTC